MTSRDFCYWLQGFFELVNQPGVQTPSTFNCDQTECIRKHLALVFKHEIDPSAGPPAHQAALNAIHDGPEPSQSGRPTIGGVGPNGQVYRC